MSTILEYKCPCCNGAIAFDSNLQKMKCPYCDTEFDVETLKQYDEELHREKPESDMHWNTEEGHQWQEGEDGAMNVYVCKSCGGEIVCDETTVATHCPYCDNPVVLMGRLSGTLRPDYVIPFKLDKKAAKESLLGHLKGKPFLPKLFRSQHHIDEIKGVYVPFWLFDADVDADVEFHATRVRGWSDSNYNYTETSHYKVFRSGQVAFDRIPVDGSQRMADDLMESIEPFDFSQAVDFQTAYLAGYLANKYDVTSEESEARVNERIRKSTEETFASTVMGYTTVTANESSIRLRNNSAKYALYPVWILNTTWKGEKYTFAMNGQTGKFVGNLPVDKGRKWGTFAALTVPCAALGYGVAWLLSYLFR